MQFSAVATFVVRNIEFNIVCGANRSSGVMSTAYTDALFRPFQVKSLTLKNRIVMAPMTRTFSPEGVPGEDVAAYYRRRAESEVGLILSEGTVIDRPAAKNHPNIPFFHGDAALAGWQRVVDEVHAAGGKMGAAALARGRGTEHRARLGASGPTGRPVRPYRAR